LTQYHNFDESGDPGKVSSAGASSHYVLAMVQMIEHAPMPELAVVRQTLHLSPRFEFKYYKTTPVQKRVFFEALQTVQFRVRSLALDKTGMPLEWIDLGGQDLTIEMITRLTLRASPLDIARDVLIVDGATPALCRALRVRLSDECRRLNRVRPFAKIVGGRSQHEDGLQVADMIAGAIRQFVIGDTDGYYRTFSNKVADLWKVPEWRK